jgi:hypothetical protein
MIKHINHTKKTFVFFLMWSSKTLKIQRMFQDCFKISKLQESFTTYKWVIMYMMYEEKITYSIIKLRNVKF